jgi:hypothetical protein
MMTLQPAFPVSFPLLGEIAVRKSRHQEHTAFGRR